MKKIYVGLKIWSTNTCYLKAIKILKEEGYFDYIELFVEPESLPEHLDIWKNLEVPFVLHAPHSAQGLNFGINENEERNRSLIRLVDIFDKKLNVSKVIFHPGIQGKLVETIRQINIFKDEFSLLFKKSIIENKPKVGLRNEDCLGAFAAEIKIIKDKTGLGFCFDLSHAMCTAALVKKQDDDVISEFLELKPELFHICDGKRNSVYDCHYHLGDGDFDLKKFFLMIPDNSFVTIETIKESKDNLDDFKLDVEYFRKCLE